MFIVTWTDENGATGQGTPWLDWELARRYAEYAARLARGRRRFAVVLAPASARVRIPVEPFSDPPPIYGRRASGHTLPLFD